MSTGNSSSSEPSDLFATTRWTVVLAAGEKEQASLALEELCRVYWYPIYAYVRRRCDSKEDAEDLTQAFFARFLQKNYLEGLNAERGRFRAFLLAALKNFLANEWDRQRSQKRGGHLIQLSLDWKTADEQFQLADSRFGSPDKAFDREWAMALLANVIERLKSAYCSEGRQNQFEYLKGFLTAEKGALSYAEVAPALGMEEGAVRVAVHRLRKRYRSMLRDEIAQTLSEASNVDDEIRALFGAFAG